MPRRGFGLTEVFFLCGAACLVVGLFLPQLLSVRESARNWGCQNNLRQIGVATDAYHERHLSLPSGYAPSGYTIDSDGAETWGWNEPSYAWSALLLSDLGHPELHESLQIDNGDLPAAIRDPARANMLRFHVGEFRCASDHLGEAMDSAPLPRYQRSLDRGSGSVYAGASSYVGSAGYFELQHPFYLAPPNQWSKQFQKATGRNNGLFYPASRVHRRQIVDGLSQTIAVGERAWYQGGASWVGTANIRGVGVGDGGMCLGRVWWRINELPQSTTSEMTGQPPTLVTRQNGLTVGRPHTARNGFGSYHLGGANFLMADGSVRFIDDQIDFHNTIPVEGANPLDPIPDTDKLGLFQKLGIRNDSLQTGEQASGASP